jgi:tetratricopeptide (TPR) repeat protein
MVGSGELLERAMALARELGDRARLAEATSGAAYFAMMQGDYAKARPMAEEADELWEGLGNLFQSAMSGHTLGQLNRMEGRYQDAWPHFRRALSMLRELGDQASMTESMLMMSALASAEGRHERAVRLLSAAMAIREGLGGATPSEWLMMGDPVEDAKSAIGDDAVDRAVAQGRAMSLDQAADYALGED